MVLIKTEPYGTKKSGWLKEEEVEQGLDNRGLCIP